MGGGRRGRTRNEEKGIKIKTEKKSWKKEAKEADFVLLPCLSIYINRRTHIFTNDKI